MIELITFVLGLLLGGGVGYFIAGRKDCHACEVRGIASHVEKQQTEKHTRKEKILVLLRERVSVTNNDIEKALGVTDTTATNYLQELESEEKIEQIGERGRFVSYRLKGIL